MLSFGTAFAATGFLNSALSTQHFHTDSHRLAGVGSVILLDVAGAVGAAFSTTRMARARVAGDGILTSGVDQECFREGWTAAA